MKKNQFAIIKNVSKFTDLYHCKKEFAGISQRTADSLMNGYKKEIIAKKSF